jgi:uncharacterized protein (DUF885 family)
MKKVIRLTESDLIRLVKRVIKEQEEDLTAQLKDFHQQSPQRGDFEDYASYKEALEDWAESSGYNDHLDKMDNSMLTSKLKDFHREMPNRGDDIEGWAEKSGYNRHLGKMDKALTRMRNKKN